MSFVLLIQIKQLEQFLFLAGYSTAVLFMSFSPLKLKLIIKCFKISNKRCFKVAAEWLEFMKGRD